jgi:hypothetical protein
MPRTGNAFDWFGILTWGNPQTTDGFSITGWNALRDDLKAELTRSLANDGTGSMTGQLKAAVGAVGAPGIVFSDELATGLYKISAGEWGFAVGGVLKYTFKSGAAVADNNTSVVTSAAITSALAAISAFVPKYASLTASAGSVAGTGAFQVLTGAAINTTWVDAVNPAVGITTNLTNGTMTIGTTGKYRITVNASMYPIEDISQTVRLAIFRDGSQQTSTLTTVSYFTGNGQEYRSFSSETILALTAGMVLDLRMNSPSPYTWSFLLGAITWTAEQIA